MHSFRVLSLLQWQCACSHCDVQQCLRRRLVLCAKGHIQLKKPSEPSIVLANGQEVVCWRTTDDEHARGLTVNNRRRGLPQGVSSAPSTQPSDQSSRRSMCAHTKSQREYWECAGTRFIKLKRGQTWDGLSLECYCCSYAKNIYFNGPDITCEEAAFRLDAWALDCPGTKAEHKQKGGRLLIEYA